jgi:uncharacterized protein
VTDLATYAILVVVGLVAGVINVLAGGGSFLTLPLLIFMGLPAAVANGTNRVGVVMQSFTAGAAFHRAQVLDWRWAATASVPALVGSALGTWGALHVGDDLFRRILAIVMVVVTFTTLLAPAPKAGGAPRQASVWWVWLGFLLVGLYGGFIQAGVGFLVLAITSWAGLDLVRGNAIKMVIVLALTLLALTIFAASGTVRWPIGLALGAGNALGGVLGARLALRKGHAWVKGFLAVMIVVFAIRLWFF